MDFGANKTPVKIIKGGEFGGTCFRDIWSVANGKWYRNSRNKLISSKLLIRSIIAQLIMMPVLIDMVLNVKQH